MKFYTVVFAAILLMFSSLSHAQQSGAPSYLAYQSFIFDDSGNPIADGEINVAVQIMDDSGVVLYEEKQIPNAIHGQISMVIGSGVDSSGAPAGGVPFEVFNSGAPRYVTVAVDGLLPFATMEVTSAPYAVFAQRANSVADGIVDGRAIADGSIMYEDLNAQLISRLNEEFLSSHKGSDFATKADIVEMYKTPDFAKQSAVKPNFVYSASGNIQNVLEDLDRAVKMRDDKIATEEKLRILEDDKLGKDIAAETTTRNTAVVNEINLRTSGDNELGRSIAAETLARDTAIANEAGLRISGDNNLGRSIAAETLARDTAIANEAGLRISGDEGLEGAITAETAARNTAIANEINLRNSKDNELERAIAAETVMRNTAIMNEAEARAGAEVAEAAHRQQGDVALGTRVDVIDSILTSERDTSVTDSLANRISQNSSRIDAENLRLTNDITRLDGFINTETSLRRSHRHITNGDGGSLAFNDRTQDGAIYVGGGYVANGSNFVTVPSAYSVDECKIITSLDRLQWEGKYCLYACPEETGFKVHCGAGSDLRCIRSYGARCTPGIDIVSGCEASYLLICVKKY